MLNNFLNKKRQPGLGKYAFLLFSLLFNNVSTADEETDLFSISWGEYSTDYSGDLSYTVEGDSGSIPFNRKADFGMTMEYSRAISSHFTLDSSFSYYSRTNGIKGTTCRDSATNILMSCNISLDSRFMALSMFGTYRHPIGSFSKIYLGSGISINRFSQKMYYEASGYKEKTISSISASPKANLAIKLGASYKRIYVEYVYFGPTNKAAISALGVSSLSVGFTF